MKLILRWAAWPHFRLTSAHVDMLCYKIVHTGWVCPDYAKVGSPLTCIKLLREFRAVYMICIRWLRTNLHALMGSFHQGSLASILNN